MLRGRPSARVRTRRCPKYVRPARTTSTPHRGGKARDTKKNVGRTDTEHASRSLLRAVAQAAAEVASQLSEREPSLELPVAHGLLGHQQHLLGLRATRHAGSCGPRVGALRQLLSGSWCQGWGWGHVRKGARAWARAFTHASLLALTSARLRLASRRMRHVARKSALSTCRGARRAHVHGVCSGHGHRAGPRGRSKGR